jgi:aspartate/tyrosine/aromatic aminotransferase
MFELAPVCPPDPVFGLAEEFKADPNPDKIDLTVGMYQDETGQTPLMDVVRQTQDSLATQPRGYVYLPIDGLPDYRHLIRSLILGEDHAAIAEGRALTAQTAGGTAALRIAGETLRRVFGVHSIWMSDPTWANHPQIFAAAALKTPGYAYLDQQRTGLDFERLLDSLERAAPRDAVLLHTICHNPTGVDPTPAQWKQLFGVITRKDLIPVFDFAYQGFGQDLEMDASPIRNYAHLRTDALICNSFSKNFGLYGERVGGITVVAKTSAAATAMMSQIKAVIRSIYSNPPTHGAAIVAHVLGDAGLRSLWERELSVMRGRIQQMRQRLFEQLTRQLPEVDFSYVTRQNGMFSYSGIKSDQVRRLKSEFSIYLLESGRINVAGITLNNIDRLSNAISQVWSTTNQR